VGVDIVPYSGRYFAARRRIEIINALDIDLVVDVGANEGQFGRELRGQGYRHRITSFEPLSSAFDSLTKNCDNSWNAHRFALGAAIGRTFLNRSRNSWSSSLLPIMSRHVQASPSSCYVSVEEVNVRTLDSFELEGRIYLKIDAQGYEMKILEGAEQTLDRAVVALELELSTTPLYEDQILMGDVLDAIRDRGFVVLSLAPAFTDPRTQEILQLDGIFAKESAITSAAVATESATNASGTRPPFGVGGGLRHEGRRCYEYVAVRGRAIGQLLRRGLRGDA